MKNTKNKLPAHRLTRKERRELRKKVNIPHTRESSRAKVTTASDALRTALTGGFDDMRKNALRIGFGQYLTDTYGLTRATAYNKLCYWHIEEWEVIGFYQMLEDFMRDIILKDVKMLSPFLYNGILTGGDTPLYPTSIEQVRNWHAVIPRGTKMKFYDYIAERGMCRERFSRIISGKTKIIQMKKDGLAEAFQRYIAT